MTALPFRIRRWRKPQDYHTLWALMKAHVQTQITTDAPAHELWLLTHHPVFTLGQAGKSKHLLDPNTNVPIVHSDRGGQITYHAPGQLIAYCLFHLNALPVPLSVRNCVHEIEGWLMDFLRQFDQIDAHRKAGQPGIYVKDAKIASLGLRIKRHISYHGLALNINCDLKNFSNINPCGFENLPMTRLVDLSPKAYDWENHTLWRNVFQERFRLETSDLIEMD